MVLGLGVALYVVGQQTVAFSEQVSQHAAAVISDEPAPNPVRPGLVSWLLGTSGRDKPIDFPPPESADWHRVSQANAKTPDILTQLTNRWPQETAPLPQHPGYEHLNYFLKIYRIN